MANKVSVLLKPGDWNVSVNEDSVEGEILPMRVYFDIKCVEHCVEVLNHPGSIYLERIEVKSECSSKFCDLDIETNVSRNGISFDIYYNPLEVEVYCFINHADLKSKLENTNEK